MVAAQRYGPRAICSLPVSNVYQDVGLDELLDAVAAVAEPVRLAFLWRAILSDADDDMVLETAMNGQAGSIVTFNRRHSSP